ncbi:MAG: hypothetical protein HHJ17_06600 [Rhodoferax sp.]|nr:hypothetical protein [Rhodoferax sp.]
MLFLPGCSDPYAARLPVNSKLTMGEVEKISAKLEPADQDVFRRWAERQTRGGSFGGEGTAPTVKIALLNQAEFDARMKIELAAANAQKAEADRIAREREKEARDKQAQLAQIATRRAEVDAEIRKQFDAHAIGYELRPLTNSYGEIVGKQFVFKLKLANKSLKNLVGAAGWVSVTDVFGADLGSYPMRIEPKMKPGQSIDYFAVMDYDYSNPKHYAITQTASLRIHWFFESVAFQDGTNIDYRTIASENGRVVPTKPQPQKGVVM